MVLIGMAFGQDEQDDIEMNEETNEESPEAIVEGNVLSQKDRAKRPFLVNVGRTNPTTGEQNFMCGGSVLSSLAILTAAHCILDSRTGTPHEPGWIDFFRYDKTDAIGTNGLVRIPLPPGACIPNPGWTPWIDGDRSEDVAICFLPTPAPDGATPITLNTNPRVPASTGVPLDVAGWGLRAEDDHPAAWTVETSVPFVTTLNYITSLECESDPYDWRNHVTASMMCAGAVPGTSWCHGDSGKNFVILSCSICVLYSFLKGYIYLLLIRWSYYIGQRWKQGRNTKACSTSGRCFSLGW
jgi:hypothetical protein